MTIIGMDHGGGPVTTGVAMEMEATVEAEAMETVAEAMETVVEAMAMETEAEIKYHKE